MTNRQRAVLLGLAALTIVVAIVIASTSGGGSDDEDVIDTRTEAVQTEASTPPTTTDATETTETIAPAPKPKPKPDTTVVVKDGKSVEGVEEFRYRQGSRIVFTVESDTADEVHLHGSDVSKDVEAGGSVRFDVPAKTDGRFEVELEHAEEQIATVEVVP